MRAFFLEQMGFANKAELFSVANLFYSDIFSRQWISGYLGPEVGIEESWKNLIGFLREYHRHCVYF
jgi:hypothetical protein